MTGFIYDLIYTVSLALTAVSYYCACTVSGGMSFCVYAVTVLSVTILTLLTHMRMKGRLMAAGIAVASAAGIYIVYRHDADMLSFESFPWLTAVLMLSFCAYVAGILMARISAVRMAAVAVAVLLIAFYVRSTPDIGSGGAFFAVFIIITVTADEIQSHWEKEGFTDRKMHLICTVPFIILTVLIAALIRYPSEPYDWKLFINAYNRIAAVGERIRFGLDPVTDGVTGFTDDGRLLTGLSPHTEEVLSVTLDSDIAAPVYLVGTISDTFNGKGWKRTDAPGLPERVIDTVESIGSVKAYDGQLKDYYRQSWLSIRYEETKSKYLFAPSKLISQGAGTSGSGITAEGNIYVFKRHNPYHLSLNEYYLQPNADSPDFYEFMKKKAVLDENLWYSAVKSSGISEQVSYETYLKYIDIVKDRYSEDISLSGALREKLDEVYNGAADPYDKLKRLEAELGRMKYTLSPAPMPDDVDSAAEYLDHFLLGSGGGYCSYYATAFVLLARAEGLPARYVQGYRLDTTGRGTYTITTDMAHAWPEVYFEGKGWIAFEPTPGFFRETVWNMPGSGTGGNAPYIPSKPVFTVSGEGMPENETAAADEIKGIPLQAAVIPLIMIAVFCVIFFVINRIMQKQRLRQLDENERLKYMAADSLSALRLMGSGISRDETLFEYRSRISGSVSDEMLGFIPVYEALLYAAPGRTCPDRDTVYDCHDRLLRLLKKKRPLRYMIRLLLS
ncbi:MAG: transglutaminase domain-containing protein [Lachnospiraceae bacterium]|nr:transglutaminase domain-containing protein [Lachnospiraceae bacterium]